ncbi:hypothetical protein Q1695_016259 [Nippostrongylus brasiliensis]|nr:hypothetical protein Q1695_016259 [Nippostrongylus brasiliensis]
MTGHQILLLVVASLSWNTEALQLLNEVLTPIGVGIGRTGLLIHNQPFTRAALDKYLTLMEDNPEYIPLEAQQLLFKLSVPTRNQIVTFFNNVATGRVVVSNDQWKIGSYVDRTIPEIADRYPAARITINRRLACMSPSTRTKITQWYNRAVATLSGSRQVLPNAVAGWVADIKSAFDQADDQTVDDIQRCEPEAFNLLTSDFIDYWVQKARLLANASSLVRAIPLRDDPNNGPSSYDSSNNSTDYPKDAEQMK